MASVRDKANAAERIQDAAQSSTGPKDWKAATTADVAESHVQEAAAGGKSTGAERALRKSQMIADMEKCNSFLASHINQRTGQYDAAFTESEWLAMPPDHQKRQVAIVEKLLADETARGGQYRMLERREPLTANPFAPTERKSR